MKKTYQIYTIHLTNGDRIKCYEEYDLPFEKGLITKFTKRSAKIIEVSDILSAKYIPLSSIVYISADGVEVVN